MIRTTIRLTRRLGRTFQHWNDLDGNLLAAAVSFYASLAAFPLIMVLLSIFGFVMRFTGAGADLQRSLMQFVSDQSSERLADQLAELFRQIQTNAFLGGPIGLLFLFMLSIALFVNFERAFARLWKTTSEPAGIIKSARRILLHRLRAFVMLLGVTLMVFLNFCANLGIDVATEFVGDFQYSKGWWRLVHTSASISLNALLFTTIYQTVPKVRVRWLLAAQGGLLAAFSWEMGRVILATFVITDRYNAFGVVGAFMGLLLWTFYGSAVIFFGGAYVYVAGQEATGSEKTA